MRLVQLDFNFHDSTVEELRELADVYVAKDDLERARSVYERILAKQEQGLGGDHPDIAVTLYALAEILADQGNYTVARPLYLRAVSILQKNNDCSLWNPGAMFELHDAYLQSDSGRHRRIESQSQPGSSDAERKEKHIA